MLLNGVPLANEVCALLNAERGVADTVMQSIDVRTRCFLRRFVRYVTRSHLSAVGECIVLSKAPLIARLGSREKALVPLELMVEGCQFVHLQGCPSDVFTKSGWVLRIRTTVNGAERGSETLVVRLASDLLKAQVARFP
jgi:hypothetical protein